MTSPFLRRSFFSLKHPFSQCTEDQQPISLPVPTSGTPNLVYQLSRQATKKAESNVCKWIMYNVRKAIVASLGLGASTDTPRSAAASTL